MRNNGSIFILTVFAAFAIGCGKTSAPDAQFDPVVRVAPEVAPQTRGSYTTETLKEFDLFIHSENSKYSYTNTKFTRNGSGEWEPARQMLWEGKNRKFKFLAVAPPLATSGHSLTDDPVFEFTVESVQTAGSKASDLLWAGQGKDGITPSDKEYFKDGKFCFKFEHILSLLKVKLTLGTEFNHNGVPENNPVSELKINGFKPTVKVGYATLMPSGSPTEIQAYQTADGWKKADDKTKNCEVTFECIVVPQSMDEFTVNFVCGGKPYTYTADLKDADGKSFIFKPSNSYTLPLTVGKDEVILDDEITVTEWGDGGTSSVETD